MKKWIRLKYTKWYNILKDGISTNNPIVISVLGICSALAITNKVSNALAMGIGVTFVIIASSAVISLLRNVIPSKVTNDCLYGYYFCFCDRCRYVLTRFLPNDC